MATAVMLAIAAAPAAASGGNAAPKIVRAEISDLSGHEVSVLVVGRDRDDVTRGAEVSWGEAGPAQGLSACEEASSRSRRADRRRRGRKARFELAHEYLEPGHYTVTVRVLSGGCGDRPQQRSAPRTLIVHVP